ncbi:uncharacterized protein STEHIDRAFT_159139 [Stereum hirsutum FP-91666 SS1]|uniref:uncharacterized protein n=1 Tax=Stereum hirsutum (strain FP-91666) TaxID=721885 RepID=UPI000444A408|nr:uncharacterized protein STEHIDRAFT_159139 [Stereum hirsutum FP-91666 SS1]EIM84468.1 hypothetical protein STEHIDRAFT_159139 [Stereum hirsutum FP-91666 SS1]
MVNWLDPTVLANDASANVKLLHVVDGLYIWEFFTTLNYEWSFVSGRRKARWTIWVYVGCRWFTLASVVTNLVGFNVTSPINCQAWIVALLVFSYFSFAFASFLVVLRSIAIWERRLPVSCLVMGIWLTEIAFLIHGVTEGKAIWLPDENTCDVLNTEKARNNVIATLATDVSLLSIMLVGLLRKRGAGMFPLWRMLYHQGLAWIALAAVAEIPPVTFLSLNLNPALNIMFQTPAMIIMTIATTRIYRGLSNFASSNLHHFDNSDHSRHHSSPTPHDVLHMRPRNHSRDRDQDSSAFDSPNHHCGFSGAKSRGPVEVTVHNTCRVFEHDDKSETNSKEQGMVVGDEEMALGTIGAKEAAPGTMTV